MIVVHVVFLDSDRTLILYWYIWNPILFFYIHLCFIKFVNNFFRSEFVNNFIESKIHDVFSRNFCNRTSRGEHMLVHNNGLIEIPWKEYSNKIIETPGP